MRLDKFLANMNVGSRKEVKVFIKKGRVQVNQQVVTSDKFQVDEAVDRVVVDGEEVSYQSDYYYLLHKPAGVISATVDATEKTVLDLFTAKDYRKDLFPVGRLDKDTEGLLIITNDGERAHQLLSPKKHVEKEYYAKVRGKMTLDDVTLFKSGMLIDGGERVMPAELKILAVHDDDTSEISLVLHEGKFHQVKRMVKAAGKEVTYLKRIRMGDLMLPEDLPKGAYRELSAAEKELLKR